MATSPPRAHCAILPPIILSRLAEHDDREVRKAAVDSMLASERLRGRRDANVFYAQPTATGTKRRTVYDAKHAATLPGTLVRGEGQKATKDAMVNEAYDGAGATYDFFEKVYQRNSIDDRGLRLDSTVHYRKRFDNAFWDGQQMVYGDGDGTYFHRFTVSLDVIGHELTHGVTDYEAALAYEYQSGALNESMSDVFGSLVKQYGLKQTAKQADWLIGAGLFTKRVKGVALRSMKAPGTAFDDPALGQDPQPDHMKRYVDTAEDNGGVHINSGIPNHAFYLTAMELGGNAWEKAGRIWYVALRDRIKSHATFQQGAQATYKVAAELFGHGSKEASAVRSGWGDVGITVK